MERESEMKHPIHFIMVGAASFLLAGISLFIAGIAGGSDALKSAGCWVVLGAGGIAAIPLLSVVLFDLIAKIRKRK